MLFRDIIATYERDVVAFEKGGDLSDSLFAALCEYYADEIAFISDDDLPEWISDRFQRDIE